VVDPVRLGEGDLVEAFEGALGPVHAEARRQVHEREAGDDAVALDHLGALVGRQLGALRLADARVESHEELAGHELGAGSRV
jgi:hypothetical protein